MKISPETSKHWSDEQLIASLYGIQREDEHLRACPECQERLSALQSGRELADRTAADEVNAEFLMAQRRRIYAKLAEPERLWSGFPVRRWVSAAGALLMLGSGVMMMEQYRHQRADSNVSDAQLALEVSRMSQDIEAQPLAPLQGLFE